jgi:hypothetical protein
VRLGSHEWERGGVSALSNRKHNLRDDASLTIYVKKVTGDWHARDLGCEVSHPTVGTHHFEINLVHVQNATSRAHSVAIESRDLVVRIADGATSSSSVRLTPLALAEREPGSAPLSAQTASLDEPPRSSAAT